MKTSPRSPPVPETEAKTFNAKVAAAYDATPYDRPPANGVEPRFLLGLGALLGGVTRANGILDIGSGVGLTLSAVAGLTDGPIVGVDISAASCDAARVNLAPYGERVKIIHADLMDLAPQDLGQFDLIYLVGLIYVAPKDVRDKALDLAAACLAPGGVLAVTYYAGAAPHIRSWLHRLLKPYPRQEGPISNTISFMRGDLEDLNLQLGNHETTALARVAIKDLMRLPDLEFEHEVFGSFFDVLQTNEVEAMLAPHGLKFVSYLQGPIHASAGTSALRAVKADAHDLRMGGYHTAIFVKTAADAPFDLTSPAILWASSLPLRPQGAKPDDPYVAVNGVRLTFHDPLLRAAIESLHQAHKTFDDLWASIAATEPEAAARTGAREGLLADMVQLLQHVYIRPLANPDYHP